MRLSKRQMRYVAQLVPPPLHKTASPENLVQSQWPIFFLQYPGVFFGTVSFPEASLVQSDVTPNSGENWLPAHYSPALPEGFPFFPSKVYFFLTQCHGSPWRGRQCTRHLKRSSFSALFSVLGITWKCTSLKYTQLFQANIACWPLGIWVTLIQVKKLLHIRVLLLLQ